MTSSGEGREIEAALVGGGCTVHDADDLGESKWDIAETQSSAFAHALFQHHAHHDIDHPPFPCTQVYSGVPCRGTVVWWEGDGLDIGAGGYRCKSCDEPYNEDGTVYRA